MWHLTVDLQLCRRAKELGRKQHDSIGKIFFPGQFNFQQVEIIFPHYPAPPAFPTNQAGSLRIRRILHQKLKGHGLFCFLYHSQSDFFSPFLLPSCRSPSPTLWRDINTLLVWKLRGYWDLMVVWNAYGTFALSFTQFNPGSTKLPYFLTKRVIYLTSFSC